MRTEYFVRIATACKSIRAANRRTKITKRIDRRFEEEMMTLDFGTSIVPAGVFLDALTDALTMPLVEKIGQIYPPQDTPEK